jgi:hypothetical protein
MVKISKKEPYKWLLKNFGIGGVENYNPKQIDRILTGIYVLLEECDSKELSFLSKMFYQLSQKPFLKEKLFQEMQEKKASNHILF